MRADDPPAVHVQYAGLEIWACTMRGRVRPENQDAWSVVTPEGVWWGPQSGASNSAAAPGTAAHCVVAVFDGVGGHPHGGEAARAAAKALVKGVAGDRSKKDVLQALDRVVRATGGATTAVVAFVGVAGDPLQVRVVAVGDSSAYRLDASGPVVRVNQRDRRNRNEVTDALGAGPLEGHEEWRELGAGFVLATDGVDDVVPLGYWVRELLDSGVGVGGVASILERLSREIDKAGAPNNATLVVVRRSGRS